MCMRFASQACPRLRAVLDLLAGAVVACQLGAGFVLAVLLIFGEMMG